MKCSSVVPIASTVAVSSLLLALGALTACDSADTLDPLAPEAPQAAAIAGAADQTVPPRRARPFQARLSGTMHVIGVCADGAGVVALMNGSGTATHLGRFTLQGDPVCVSMGPADWEIRSTGTLTAADGDEIFVSLQPAGYTPDGWELWAGEVTGGTGRFTDAAGELRQPVRLTTMPAPPDPGLWVAAMDGWIAY